MKPRQVIIDSDSEVSIEEMPSGTSKTPSKSGGKGSSATPISKDLGKEGKRKGGSKSSASARAKFTTEKVELKIENELPSNARCLMDCEAADLLQDIQEQLTILSNDPAIKMPESFSKGLQYAKSGIQYENSRSVRETLEMLKQHKVSDGEICVIGNVCPETVEEAFALVPSLEANKVQNKDPIRKALTNLSMLHQSS